MLKKKAEMINYPGDSCSVEFTQGPGSIPDSEN